MEDKIDCLLDMIPQESHFYYYFRGCWANGKKGSISDSNGHGVYRFYPFIKDENGNQIDAEIDFDDYATNPVVAMGIIGYWLHYRKNNDRLASYTTWTKEDERKNTLKIFTDYTEDKLNQYIEREQYSPSSWRRDLKKEFYMDFIIRNEEPLNEKTQALMEYITPSDQQQVKEVITEYMLFLEEKRKEYKYNSSERKFSPNAGNKRKPKVAKNKDAFTKTTFTCKELEGYQFMEQRRGILCNLLFECFVASKKEKEDIEREKIEKLFSGKSLKEKEKITWKGTKKELVYFFRQLKNYLEYSSKENFWNVVASHFVIETQGKKIVQGQRKVRYVAISADSLQSTTGKPKKDIMKKLDGIINVLTAPIADVLQLHRNSTEGDAEETRYKDLAEKDLRNELLGFKDKK
jgi:hypothetical protein